MERFKRNWRYAAVSRVAPESRLRDNVRAVQTCQRQQTQRDALKLTRLPTSSDLLRVIGGF
jgi:hypothetical protein